MRKIVCHICALPYLSVLKTTASILLLGLLLFNWFGYQAVVNYLKSATDKKVELAIEENNYCPEQIFEITVATNLPYTNDWSDWERISGSVEVNGVYYQYIERKLTNGSMTYRCLHNFEKQNLLAARDEFFQLVNNFNNQTDRNTTQTVVINNFIGDYDDLTSCFQVEAPAHFVSLNKTRIYYQSAIVKLGGNTPDQPPKC